VLATDLGRTNGTSVDGQPLTAPMVLQPGARLTIGSTVVQFAREMDEAVASGSFDMKATSIDLLAASVDTSPVDPTHLGHDCGTITIVFSDIESSTERAAALGGCLLVSGPRQTQRDRAAAGP